MGLELASQHFRLIEAATPPAQWVPWQDGFNWRFIERHPVQALLQKLARQISGTKAVSLLISVGFLQEIGVLFRTLDEISEDIAFITTGLTVGEWTPDHDKYLEYFWSEDNGHKGPPVQRKRIRSYVQTANGLDTRAAAGEAARTIHRAYSDYVHARSAPTMAMVHGPPARFDLNPISNNESRMPYVQQAPSYAYRCLASALLIGRLVLPVATASNFYSKVCEYERMFDGELFAMSGLSPT